MGAKLNSTHIEVIRQEYLAGDSLRVLAKRHGISLRALANHSKTGEWEAHRRIQHSATNLPAVVAAADRRCQAVAEGWRNRLEGLADKCMGVAVRASELLARDTLECADFRDLASLIKLQIEVLSKLNELLASTKDNRMPKDNFLGMDRATAVEFLRRRGRVMLPEERRALLAPPAPVTVDTQAGNG